MQHVRHVSKNRRMFVILAVVIYGCSTDNPENWAITTPGAAPAANNKINYASTPVNVPVAGTTSVNNSKNNIAIIDPATNVFLSTTAVVIRDTSGNWTGAVTLQSAPAAILPGGDKPANVCSGQPNPSISGTTITKHTTLDVVIHLQRYQY